MIRVLIERYIAEDCLDKYFDMIRRAKNKASNVPGFLAGEVFETAGEPNHVIVMSTWDSVDSWETWAESEQRQCLLQEMRPLLTADETILVLEPHSLKAPE